jgi:hypothetical protein
MDLYSLGFRNKFCMHLSTVPCMLHVPSFSSLSI